MAEEPAREPDWTAAEAILREMIAEAGGVPDEARAWAVSVLAAADSSPANLFVVRGASS